MIGEFFLVFLNSLVIIQLMEKYLIVSFLPQNIASIGNNYTFFADPFYACNDSSIFIEGMNAISGLGEIIELEFLT